MALLVEDGSGVAGAESYAAVAAATAYWANRPQDPNAAIWTAAASVTGKQDGSLREASAYLDATFGASYVGSRKTAEQGLLWPRVDRSSGSDTPLIDGDGLPVAALPVALVTAAIELAARATVAPLAPDTTSQGWVKRRKEKVGPLEEEIEYGAAGPQDGSYGFVERLLGPLIGGVISGEPSWLWL